MPRVLNRVTCNLNGATKRYETLDGQEYLVIPTVALTEGVHNGSQGPLYYPPEEVERPTLQWNHKPAVICHPVKNGDGITACDPSIIESQGVGLTFGADYDGRSKMEVWCREDKLRRLAPDVLNRINNGEMVEVSTGIYNEIEYKSGEWNGEKYIGIVRNIQPDHLAILPDEKGACSIADGAGLLRNAEKTAKEELSFDDIRSQICGLMREKDTKPVGCDYGWVCDVYPKFAIYECDGKCYKVNYKISKLNVSLEGTPEEVRKVTSYVTANKETVTVGPKERVWCTLNGRVLTNEDMQGPVKLPKPSWDQLSDIMKKQHINKALISKYSGTQQEGDWGGWVVDMVANYAVYSKDGKLWRLPYTYDDDMVRFDDGVDPTEVERVSEYREKSNTPIDGTSSPYARSLNREQAVPPAAKPGTQNAIHQGAHEIVAAATGGANKHPDGQHRTQTGDSEQHGGAESRKEMVNKMIGGGMWQEEDRSMLESLPDDHFERMQKFSERGATTTIQPYSYEGVGDRSNANAHTPTGNRTQQAPTLNAWMATAPPEVQRLVQNAQRAELAERKRYSTFLSERQPRLNPKYLDSLDIQALRVMADLAGINTQEPAITGNYAGQGEIPMYLENVDNSQGDDDEGVLKMPRMDDYEDTTPAAAK